MKKFKVFDESQLNKLKKILHSADWQDGKASALGAAKDKKVNFQLASTDPLFKDIIPYVEQVHQNEVVKAYTNIKALIDPRAALYRTGGKYGWHVDTTIMNNYRTDLSFTICLNSPEDYEGGILSIDLQGSIAQFKGEAGEMIVYPSGYHHEVSPVISGERMVIVGWISSHIKEEGHRQRLYDLRMALHKLVLNYGHQELSEITKVYHQLNRDFS